MSTLLVYGAYGFTGRLVATELVARGESPVVAGRDPDRVARLAASLGLEGRSFALDSTDAVATELEGVDAVCNCAGPFTATVDPIVEACLATETDYLDVTGELEVFARLAGLDERASRAGVTLVPGVGFDVVPSDCLAAFLHRQLPDATGLSLAISGSGPFSRGTARTLVGYLGADGVVRENGRLRRVPVAHDAREVDFGFGHGRRTAATVPWGDLVTAPRSTGVEDVAVYVAVPPGVIRLMRATEPLGPLLGSRPVHAGLDRLIRATVDGPGPAEREGSDAVVWGEIRAGDRTACARVRTPNPYDLTAETAAAASIEVGRGDVDPGFQTPATAFGPDFVLEASGVERERLTGSESVENS